MMGCLNLFRACFAFFNLFLVCCFSFTVSGNPSDGYYIQELDALVALKQMFNDTFLNANWSGIYCSQDPLRPPWYGIQCDSGHVTGITLESMGLIGKVNEDALIEFPELTTISFKNNSISGNLMNFSSNQKLKDIDLSANSFDGKLSNSLLSLKFLESLQLQDNKLTGQILELNQSSLRVLNFSDNNLSGPIPDTPILQSFGKSSYSNNPQLCGPPLPNPCTSSNDAATKNDKKHSNLIPIMAVLVAVVGFVGIVFFFVLYFKRSRKPKRVKKDSDSEEVNSGVRKEDEEIERKVADLGKQKVIGEKEEGKLIFIENEAADFQLNDLLKASAEGLGKGIFGNSYKAKLRGRAAVVVKRLRDLKPMSNEEFTKQLLIIGNLKHPNLQPLLAYYYSKEEKLLVYKYAENGNLFKRLHGNAGGGTSSKDRIPFRWNSRLSVARGVARALEYLHLSTKSQSSVPHGNLKLSNILLDENDQVLLSDYGLTALVAHPIAVQRLVSYKSPEYQTSKRVSRKSDVWSFGCLLLELLTGRISVYSAPPGIKGVDLTSWVIRAVREEWTAEILDNEISVKRNAYPGMLKLLRIAIQCCDKSPEKRPEMTEVVRQLENIRVVESEDDEDFSSEQSYTDDSLSANASR